MRQSTKKLVVLGAVVPLVIAVAVAATQSADKPTNAPASVPSTAGETSQVLATGKGVNVTRDQLDQEMVRIKATLAAQGRALPGDTLAVERQVLESLISRQLLLARTTEADQAKGKQDFAASMQQFKNGRMTEEEFNQRLDQQLQVLNMTRQEWEKQGIEQATLPLTLQRELNVNVSDDQVKKYYDENPGQFEQPEMVRAAHVLLMTIDPATRKPVSDEEKAAKKKQMEDILKKARAGDDFAKLAKEYSEDPGSKDRGGEYTFPRGQMTPEFESAAFSLKTNQISDIVTSPYGYHIIKVYEKIPAKVVELAKVAPEIKELLVQQEIKQRLPSFIEKLKSDADVKILDEKLSAVQVPEVPGNRQAAPGATKPATGGNQPVAK